MAQVHSLEIAEMKPQDFQVALMPEYTAWKLQRRENHRLKDYIRHTKTFGFDIVFPGPSRVGALRLCSHKLMTP